eukprot:1161148-Pelagomonas_calceolata.AAC.4
MAGVESQKETFRKYLESAGAIDVLVKGESALPMHTHPGTAPIFAVLVSLYEEPEKPKGALE